MADSRRKLNTPRLRPIKPLQIPEIETDRDETVGCLRRTVLAAIFLLIFALAAVIVVFVIVQVERLSEKQAGPGRVGAPGGVTVAVKQADPKKIEPGALPDAGASQKLPGFAIDLGSAQSFSELSRRFAEIATQNAELQFDALEPRATLTDTIDGLEARLLVGPFETLAQAIEACRNIALPSGIECKAVGFAGEKIARE
jgi:hypothetical protein